MTLTSAPSGERARLDGRVVATDLDRALELLEQAERARAEAATLLAGLQTTGLERFCGYVSWERLVAHRTACGNRASFALMRSARHLGRFARTASALAAGAIGLAHVEVLARAAAGLANAYERDEPELLALAERVEPEELERSAASGTSGSTSRPQRTTPSIVSRPGALGPAGLRRFPHRPLLARPHCRQHRPHGPRHQPRPHRLDHRAPHVGPTTGRPAHRSLCRSSGHRRR